MRASDLFGLSVLLALPTCAHDSVPAEDQGMHCDVSRCYEEAGSTCGAGNLPRIAPGAWSDQEVRDFMGRFPTGTVAVELAAGQSRLAAECKLDGAYTELKGKDRSARLWATNRILLLPSEIAEGCDGATHLVAAFVTRGSIFSAVLVPLPCPSTSGEAGERIAVLAPERLPPRVAAPSLDEDRSSYDCSYQPAFRKCFPSLFEASPGPMGCWERASREAGPQ